MNIFQKILLKINNKFRYLIWPLILIAAITLDKHRFGWILSIPLAVIIISKIYEIFNDTYTLKE